MSMHGILLAIDTNGLNPAGTISLDGTLWTAIALACVGALACVVLAVWLSRARKARRKPAGHHVEQGSRQAWLKRVNDVVRRYDAGQIDEDEAYAELAALTRSFASAQSGRCLDTRTLSDLEREPRTGNARNWDALRLTIGALYPLEFAATGTHSADVATAAGWVADFVERWR
ncbi:MAG: hypothetical protein UHD09_02595 [Bifidobacterium sp.]|nr:hypothetical protein [Bifidobacterium sp.]